MKTKLLFLLLSLVAVSPIKGQNVFTDYHPFVEEGKTWLVEYKRLTASGTEVGTKTFTLKGDTVIGGVMYNCLLCDGRYMGAFREAGEKVYFIDNSGTESLHYDFTLHLGEKIIFPEYGQPNEFEVFLEDTVQSGGPALRRLGLFYSGEPETGVIKGMQSQWIEGVGNLWGPLFCLHFDWSGSTFSLLSCKIGNEVLYQFEPTYFPEGTKWTEIRLDSSKHSSWFRKEDGKWEPNFERLDYYVEGETSDRSLRYTKVFCKREGMTDSLSYLIQVMNHGLENEVHVTSPETFDSNRNSFPVLTYDFDWKVGKTLEYQTPSVSQQNNEYDVQQYGTIEEILERDFGGVHPLKYVDLGEHRIIKGIGLTSWEGSGCIFGPIKSHESSRDSNSDSYRSILVHFERGGQVLYDEWPMPEGITEVSEIKEIHKGSAPPFDLSGRRLNTSHPTHRGVYIIDGKKVVVK